jgi:hypothetical protein
VAARIAENRFHRQYLVTLRTLKPQRLPAFQAEFGFVSVIKPALWAFHRSAAQFVTKTVQRKTGAGR